MLPPVQARDLFDLSAAMRDASRSRDARTAVRARSCDQLRGLPAARLARVVRLEPEPDVRAPRRAAALALLLAGLHEHGGRLAGRAREPHRRGCDRRRAARRVARGAALRRRELRADERAARRERGGLDRPRPDVLAAARARAGRGARARADSGEDPELRRRAVGPASRALREGASRSIPGRRRSAIRRPRRTSRPRSRSSARRAAREPRLPARRRVGLERSREHRRATHRCSGTSSSTSRSTER